MKRGYDDPINGRFVRGTLALATCNAENPFEKGSRAGYLYFRIKFCYDVWHANRIDSRVHRIKMYRAAVELAELNLENPFVCADDYDVEPVVEPSTETVSLEELAEVELTKALAEDVASETFVPAVDVYRVFSVLPNDNCEVE